MLDCHKTRAEQPQQVAHNCIEYRFRVCHRGADRGENFRRFRLLFQSLRQLAGQLRNLCFLLGSGGTTAAHGL
jgi:hypothetical protein